jgi:hypothetical protein
MEEIRLQPPSAEVADLLSAYLRERVIPHPILSPFLRDAAVCAAGAATSGDWDEEGELDVRWVLPDEDHARLSAALREARLWDPARDSRLVIQDREPFRRFPGAEMKILSAAQLVQEFRFDLPVTLWVYTHAAVLEDPSGLLESTTQGFAERFQARLPDLQCEHYFRFRQARNDLTPKVMPRRLATVLAIKRGEAVREALRLAFLADGLPYPHDRWLEPMAERETRCGAGIITAVRALVAAREAHTVERAGKVLRDRVAFALQQGGVSERWLEQWWLWPGIAPTVE